MKIKKIKLLKALALTGAFGIVATVPVIVSACSSTSDNNTGGGNGGGTQTQTITPQIKSTSTLSGALSNIYDTANTGNTNTLIAEEIKKNLSSVFDNGEALSAVSDLEVTVSHTFPASTWEGTAYAGDNGWSTTSGITSVLYDYTSNPLTITSLSNLKEQLDDAKIKEIFTAAGTNPTADTTYAVQNALGFTNKNNGAENRDLLHVNVLATTTPQSGTATTANFDLQIPVSDLNLQLDNLSVTVKGTNVAETTAQTTLTYNIGINDVQNFTQPSTNPTITEANKENVNEALVSLGYATNDSGTYNLNNEAIAAGLGIYNAEFTAVSIAPVSGSTDQFTITLSATPKSGYVWEDGTTTAKEVSFNATFTVS